MRAGNDGALTGPTAGILKPYCPRWHIGHSPGRGWTALRRGKTLMPFGAVCAAVCLRDATAAGLAIKLAAQEALWGDRR